MLLTASLFVVTSCARDARGPGAPDPSAPNPGAYPGQHGPVQQGPAHPAPNQYGLATYYGDSLAGNKTASGEVYDPRAMTAAHRKLPFGTMVEVTRRGTGERVVVRITDRGPFGDERRIIDLSTAAAEQLNMIRAGVVEVRVRVLR